MIKARRIGHAVFETKDIDRLTEHYTDLVGLTVAARERGKVFLASRLGQLAVELRQGTEVGCRKLSFEVANDTDLTEVTNNLGKLGIKAERSNDTAPGIANTLTFDDLKGTKIELFTSWSTIGDGQPPKGIPVTKLGHVAFFSTDLPKTVEFYSTVLGFKVSDWIGDVFVFLRCNPDHHTVNFCKGEHAELHHIAFELADWNQMKTALDLLAKRKVALAWGPVRHGAGHNISIYYRETDDQLVELFMDLDRIVDEELGYFEPRPWHRDNPQRPRVWEPGAEAIIWGSPPTPDFFRGRGQPSKTS